MTKKRTQTKPVPQLGVHGALNDSDFERVIDIVSAGYDPQKIVVALIKKHPNIFLDLYESISEEPQSWKKEIVQLVYASNKVGAIKVLRDNLSLSLKDAKDVIDNLQTRMATIGYMVAPSTTASPVGGNLVQVLDDLAQVAWQIK